MSERLDHSVFGNSQASQRVSYLGETDVAGRDFVEAAIIFPKEHPYVTATILATGAASLVTEPAAAAQAITNNPTGVSDFINSAIELGKEYWYLGIPLAMADGLVDAIVDTNRENEARDFHNKSVKEQASESKEKISSEVIEAQMYPPVSGRQFVSMWSAKALTEGAEMATVLLAADALNSSDPTIPAGLRAVGSVSVAAASIYALIPDSLAPVASRIIKGALDVVGTVGTRGN